MMTTEYKDRGKLYVPEGIAGRVALWQSMTHTEIGGLGSVEENKVTNLWFDASEISGGGHDIDGADLLKAFSKRMAEVEDPMSVNTIWHTHPFGGGAGWSAMDEGTIREMTSGGRGFYFVLFSDNPIKTATAKYVIRKNGKQVVTLLTVTYLVNKETLEGMDGIEQAVRKARKHVSAGTPAGSHNHRGWPPGKHGGDEPLSNWHFKGGRWRRNDDPDDWISVWRVANVYGVSFDEARSLLATYPIGELLDEEDLLV